jgi:REP element-mobilizing transposase RayT
MMQIEFDLRNAQDRATLRGVKAWSFGGLSLRRRRKTKRPLIEGRWTHLIFKSSRAHGDWSLLKRYNRFFADQLLKQVSRRFYVQIRAGSFVNMGNHLHLVVRFNDRKRFGQFLKSFSAQLARRVTGARRGQPKGRFWDGIPFTRVLRTSIEELQIRGYLRANLIERTLSRSEREEYLKNWNSYIKRLKAVRAGPSEMEGSSGW